MMIPSSPTVGKIKMPEQGTWAEAADFVPRGPGRWGQLALGIVGMMMIANLQYGWTLFVVPIDQAHHWGIASIQVAFTLFVLGETWLLPFQGYLIDWVGPRPTVAVGGVLVAAGWLLNSFADS